MDVRFDKALKILEKLLQGKSPKEIAYEMDCSVQAVSVSKKMFPLFTKHI
jgi:DNA-binding CsgD family transcriptional regulator